MVTREGHWRNPKPLEKWFTSYELGFPLDHKMAMSEDHDSCWVHKDLTVTAKKIQDLLTAARVSGGEDECQVRLTGIEREY